jgi:hypothetical protein
MKTQDTVQMRLSRVARSGGRRWLAGAGIVLLVSFISLSAVACMRSGSQPGSQGVLKAPAGKWIQMLRGYTVTSLAAASNDSAVIYACAVSSQTQGRISNSTGSSIYTLLRSADFGAHWQDIGNKAIFGSSCAFAINPTNSNDIYAVSTSSGSQHGVLQHSTDGGQTWSTLLPTLQDSTLPGFQLAPAWHILQLSVAGNQLFGVQSLQRPPPSAPGIATVPNLPSPRLVTSTDGGHTWTVLDSRLNTTMPEVRSYSVDPTNPDRVYELVGAPSNVIQNPVVSRGSDVASIADDAPQEGLYKTTDGGATWHLVLRDVTFGDQVSLASNTPDLVYVGGSVSVPYQQDTALPNGTFQLRVSSDGGTNWREVAIPSELSNTRQWFVGSDGKVYAFMGMIPTTTVVHTPTATVSTTSSIQRYDPAAGKWSEVSKPPSPGSLLAVTSPGAGSGAELWFMGTSNGSKTLYRNVV